MRCWVVVLLAGGMLGCSDGAGEKDRDSGAGDAGSQLIFIYAFDNKYIKVGSTDTADVILSAQVKAKTYVEVSNSDPKVVAVSYGSAKDDSIVIEYNVSQDRKTIMLRGLKEGTADIKFKIRGKSTWSFLGVRVVP